MTYKSLLTHRLKEVFMKNKEMCSVLPNPLYTGFWREAWFVRKLWWVVSSFQLPDLTFL